MTKFKVTYFRNVTEVYEVELEGKDEESVEDIIYNSKYGTPIKGEKLINKFSDDVEIDEIEEVE